ncbi:MAG: DUF86 domain-containing protein [Candidatus Poribacteria bacterium]|nr:DUF86 domain-containing protein [Candidatus Poribacteria bacterium]
MRREAHALLLDVRDACEQIIERTQDLTLDDYHRDRWLRVGVERFFIIIGEAMNQAVRMEPELDDRISDIQDIIDFRHVLVHGYAQVEDDVVWDILSCDLRPLHDEVAAILREEGVTY